MALPQVPEEKAYGAVQEEAALEAAAPPPIEETPVQADAASEEAVAQVAQQAMTEQQAPTQSQGYTVKNPYMLLPARMNMSGFTGDTRKTRLVANRDMSMFWDLLASDPQSDRTVRVIAKALKGGK
jgi:hypothetical protein